MRLIRNISFLVLVISWMAWGGQGANASPRSIACDGQSCGERCCTQTQGQCGSQCLYCGYATSETTDCEGVIGFLECTCTGPKIQ